MEYPINDEGVDLLKTSEDFVGVAYPDPVSPLGKALQKAGVWRKVLKGAPIPAQFASLSGKPWTIGYGFTDGVKQGDTMTMAEGNAQLARRLRPYRDAVLAACKVEPTENQLAALVVCAWNIGIGAITSSSMVKAHNRSDFAAAARAFSLWTKAGGAVVPALVTRRAHEAALYLKPVAGASHVDVPQDDEVGPEPMPQTVQGETSLLRSPIIQGTVGSATTGIATLASVADQASTAKSAWDVLQPLMPYLPYIAIGLIVVAAGYVIYTRVIQRRGGWA